MARGLRLGAVADDYTGATDLAGALAAQGARTIQVLGRRPAGETAALVRGFDAAVVALKSRAEPAAKAVDDSGAVARALREAGAAQIYFKYCSTFDSTAEGNIGPVTDALMSELGVTFTIAAPAFPANGRTQYLGHLFVGGELLSESPLRHHPRNPMTDANLVRHLQHQTRRRVGLLAHADVRAGAGRIAEAARGLVRAGVEIALADAVSDADLDALAEAFADAPLLTGGSALGARLGALWRARGLVGGAEREAAWAPAGGPVVIVAGSCSARTLEQIEDFRRRGRPIVPMDVRAVVLGDAAGERRRLEAEAVAAAARAGAVLVCSSMAPEARGPLLAVAAAAGVGADEVGRRLESLAADFVRGLVGGGVRKIVVAGGETSGAVVEALDPPALEIGAEIDPGVPRCRTADARRLELVLKSGNFGSVDFFEKCVGLLEGRAAASDGD